MATPRYDSFEIAVLVDAIHRAEGKSSPSLDDISSVLQEMSYVLELLLENNAAEACRTLASAVSAEQETVNTANDLMTAMKPLADAEDLEITELAERIKTLLESEADDSIK